MEIIKFLATEAIYCTSSSRHSEPVVLTGEEVGMGEVGVDSLVAFRREEGAWVQVPVQVGEEGGGGVAGGREARGGLGAGEAGGLQDPQEGADQSGLLGHGHLYRCGRAGYGGVGEDMGYAMVCYGRVSHFI